jgi:Tol biopolymer transport system component
MVVLIAAAVGMGPGSVAAPGDVVLASTSDLGIKANDDSTQVSVSADGSKVAFTSTATNLDPADTDEVPDVYVKDLVTGDLALASTSDDGVKGDAWSGQPSLSADGTRVAFTSTAANLDPADPDVIEDVYVKDLVTGDLTLASTSDMGVKGDGHSAIPSISGDGTAVAFGTAAANLDPADSDGSPDVYVKEITTGDLSLVSTSDDGTKGNAYSHFPSVSFDGDTIAFHSTATNLDPLDPDVTADVYVKDLVSGALTLASTPEAGVKADGMSVNASLSADGTKVAFLSLAENLDPADDNFLEDVYVKDLVTGDVVLASASISGTVGNSISYDPSLSGDGTKVAFTTEANNLGAADGNAVSDVYVKDLLTGEIAPASTSADGAVGDHPSDEPSVSADGLQVAFGSLATTFVPTDTDALNDVYVKELGVVRSCTITGTPRDDSLKGTPGDDVICGLGGDDRIHGVGGDDILLGGDGHDLLVGGKGDDMLRGEGGGDKLRALDGVAANDLVDGGAGRDRCLADPGDFLVGCP